MPNDADEMRALREAVVRLSAQLAGGEMSAANQLMAPPGPTVAELCRWWLSTKAFKRLSSGVDRRHHVEGYIIPSLGEYTQATLTSDAVEGMLEAARERGELSGSSLNGIRAALSKIINDARSTVPPRWTAANPVGGVGRYDTVEREPPMLTREQAWGLIESSPAHWRAVFAVAIYLGLRAGEIRALKVVDVDPIQRVLHVRSGGRRETTKSGKARAMPIPDELWPMLARARKERAGGEFLFGYGGHPLTKNWKSAALMRATLKRAGLLSSVFWVCNHKKGCQRSYDEEVEGGWCPGCGYKLRRTTRPLEMDFHDLRHVSATLHQHADCHIWVMAKVLGHAMPKVMTLRYTHFSTEQVRAELNKLKLMPACQEPPPGGTDGGNVESDESMSQGDTQSMESARSSVGQSIGLRIRCAPKPGGLPLESESPDPIAVARFWSAVARGAPGACWIWTGGTGQTRILGRQYQVQRAAFMLAHGTLGERQAVLATCSQSLCCNPGHLFASPLGRPRAAIGSANGRAKLTPLMVAEVRRAHAAGELSIKQLARLNGVSPKAIRKVLSGQTWREQ